jgi:hypothetical protein
MANLASLAILNNPLANQNEVPQANHHHSVIGFLVLMKCQRTPQRDSPSRDSSSFHFSCAEASACERPSSKHCFANCKPKQAEPTREMGADKTILCLSFY